MTTAFTTLGAEHINAHVHALLNVLGMPNHVHIEKPVFVELVNDRLGRNTDGRDEKSSARFNNDIGELVEPAIGVVMANESEQILSIRQSE